MNDDEIIQLYFERNQSAIAETSEKYGAYCKKISYNILYNEQDTEECVNDSYLKLWQAIPPKKPNCLRTYLGKLVRNISINKYEKDHAQKRGAGETDIILSELEECISSTSSIESEFDRKELTTAINNFLSTLKKEKRIVFVRRYWYMSSVSEVAEICEISQSKVKSILFRVRKDLYEYLQKEELL